MILTKAQIKYIENRRNELDKQELAIRRDRDINRDDSDNQKIIDRTAKIVAIQTERTFFNHMIDLHNVEIDNLKKAKKQFYYF